MVDARTFTFPLSDEECPKGTHIRRGETRFLRIQNRDGMGPVEGLMDILCKKRVMFEFVSNKSPIASVYKRFFIDTPNSGDRCVVGSDWGGEYKSKLKASFCFAVLPEQIPSGVDAEFCSKINLEIRRLVPDVDPAIPTFDIYEGVTRVPCLVSKLEIAYVRDAATLCRAGMLGTWNSIANACMTTLSA